jgi:hypothetical protein
MITTKINGGVPAIVYRSNNGEDYLPVKVYASTQFDDIGLQTPISAVSEEEAGTGKIENIITEYNKSLISLDIQGTSYLGESPSPENIQPIENANNNGMTISFHSTNLATAQQIFNGFRNYFKTVLDGRTVIMYTCNRIVKNVIEGGFKENTRYTISGEWYSTLREGTGDTSYTLFIYYTDGTSWFHTLPKRNEWIKVKITTADGKTVKAIGMGNSGYMINMYVDVDKFQINEGTEVLPYEPYFRTAFVVPKELEDGAPGTIDAHNRILLSKYDKIAFRSLAPGQSVESEWGASCSYIQGSYYRMFDNTDNFQLVTTDIGNIYEFTPTDANGNLIEIDEIFGSNQFEVGNLYDGNYRVRLVGNAIVFKTDGNMTLTDFTYWLSEQNTNGNPVTILCRRKSASQKTIPLMSIAEDFFNSVKIERKYKNLLEVESNTNAPQTPINLNYYIWGGRNENNSNT